MSDEEEFDLSEESEDDGDFSASEEEYDPTKDKDAVSESEDEDLNETHSTEDDDERTDESFNDSRKRKWPKSSQKSRKSNKANMSSSFRHSTINKYKNATKNFCSNPNVSSNLKEILMRSQLAKKKILNPSQSTSQKDDSDKDEAPNFDCDAGLRLSDSESDEDETNNIKIPVHKFRSARNQETDQQTSQSNPATNHDNMAKILENLMQTEKVQEQLKSIQEKSLVPEKNIDELNVSQLLAIGESLGGPSKSEKKSHKAMSDSESDWEDVEGNDHHETQQKINIPKEGLEITVNPFGDKKVKKEKEIDVEMSMRRKFNRVKKENQVFLHKTNLLCWIGHGNFVNPILNNTSLMTMCLKMLPKNDNHCYPKEKTDCKYFKQIADWFKTQIALKNREMWCKMPKRPHLLTSLALQIKAKAAISRRDFVLIFIILLRAIGIQCRMVMNLNLAPIKPPQSELLSLSTKSDKSKKSKPDESNGEGSISKYTTYSSSTSFAKARSKTKSSSSSKTEKSSEKSSGSKKSKKNSVDKENEGSTEVVTRSTRSKTKKASNEPARQPLIPQLDGADDVPKKARKPLKIKALKGFEVSMTQSFVNLSEDDGSPKPSTSGVTRHAVKRTAPREHISSPKKLRSSSKTRASTSMDNNHQSDSGKEKDSKKTAKKEKEAIKIPTVETSKKNPTPAKTEARKDEKDKPQLSKLRDIKRKSVHFSASTEGGSPVVPKSETVNDKKKTSEKPPTRASERTSRNTQKAKEDPKEKAEEPKPAKRSRSGSKSKKQETEEQEKPSAASKPNLSKLKEISNKPEASTSKANNLKAGSKRPSSAAEKDKEDKGGKKMKIESTTKTSKRSSSKSKKKEEDAESEDDIFEAEKVLSKRSSRDRRVLSSDLDETVVDSSKDPKSKKVGIDIWVELYSEKDEKWIPVDVFKGKIGCTEDIIKAASHPITYVLAWNNDNSIKDITAKYCPSFNTVTRKLRVEREYLEAVLNKFKGPRTARDRKEDAAIAQLHIEQELPTAISDYKNHPLYALKRHLLKFEAIYPPDAPTVGFIREEPVYPRDCVFTLHSREIWVKQAKTVKPFEKPYKIVLARPKWDRATNSVIKDIPLELFGIWQTQDYEPPTAENGMVPRNAYGNVELFKACMLPKKTVHIQLPGLNKVCKKLNIDCAQAVVGFDFHGGSSHPVFDGFVICEEFAEKVVDAWNREQEEIELKEETKREKRVLDNWKKLIKGLLIREKLKNKYNF